MAEERLNCVLPLMFRQIKVSRRAKEELRMQLFSITALPDDELSYIAAAGGKLETKKNKDNNQEE
ncbi:MAG: hypothetical protein FWG69_00785 [Oscillospiraceae bacterium]|nr:hypothetical protein [Oscillospiraceae bacterium]